MLIFGVSVTEVLVATLFFTCETCGNNAAHQLSRRAKRFSLFFIPLLTFGARHFDACTACGRVIEIPRAQAEAAARQTGPELR